MKTDTPAEDVNVRNEDDSNDIDSPDIDSVDDDDMSYARMADFNQDVYNNSLSRKEYMLAPSSDEWTKCYIDRIKSKGWSKFNRKYALYHEDGSFIAIVEKKSNNKTAHYIVSTDPRELDRSNPSFVGKVRSNFTGSEFTGYDGGNNPKKGGIHREEHIHIVYENASITSHRCKLKDIRLVIPQIVQAGKERERVRCRPNHPETQGLAAIDKSLPVFDRSNTDEISRVRTYVNKHGTWSHEEHCYLINWACARRPILSTRNCQIVRSDDPTDIAVQFSKTSTTRFCLDFRSPFSPYQATCLAISLMDYKLTII